ncbi:TPA: hypothetical protein ACKLW7_002028, partial [Neisseria gonorrhoeae]
MSEAEDTAATPKAV